MEAPRQHGEVTRLLVDFAAGDREALDRLLPVVHEAYLTLVDQSRARPGDRVRFFAVAATAMRRVLIEYARRRRAAKRGGGERPLSLDETAVAATDSAERLLA